MPIALLTFFNVLVYRFLQTIVFLLALPVFVMLLYLLLKS